VLVYSRNTTLVANARRLAPRVEALDPEPPSGAGPSSRWLARAVAAFGLDVSHPAPRAVPTPAEDADASRLGAGLSPGFLALHPGSGSARKNWPAHRFAELARRLSPDAPWLLVEGPADRGAVAPLETLPGAVVVRNAPPRVLGALLARSRAYVGNDSGVTHLAAAWGAPTVALFGPTDPAVWAPEGSHLAVAHADDIASIPVEAVASALPGSSLSLGLR
jgi:heptosyltransferase-3